MHRRTFPRTRHLAACQFGIITATQTVDQAGPRTVQFSLRYSF